MVAVTAAGPASTTNAALAGPASESAGAEPATRGNDAGTASQIRPQAVSVWVGVPLGTTGDGVEPPGTGVSAARGGVAAEAGDVADDRGEAADDVGPRPSPLHPAAINVAARRPPNREALPDERRVGSVTRSS